MLEISCRGTFVLLENIVFLSSFVHLEYKNIYSTKKLRKLCLRGYDKRSKTFKDFLISQLYNMTIFLDNDALSGSVAPIAA